MKVLIEWSAQARFDLQNIYDFISEDSVYYAEMELIKIHASTEILLKQIFAGRVVPEIGNNSIREIICGNYRIVYKVLNEQLAVILTVHHGSLIQN